MTVCFAVEWDPWSHGDTVDNVPRTLLSNLCLLIRVKYLLQMYSFKTLKLV